MIVQLLADRPGCIPSPGPPDTAAKAGGYWHEEKMHRRFEEAYRELYLPSPWFRYRPKSGYFPWRYCQPDGLLFLPDKGRCIIAEAKLQHTASAVGQLGRYLRVVGELFPSWECVRLEVVRFYKGQGLDRIEEPVRVVMRPEGAQPGIFNVLILGRW